MPQITAILSPFALAVTDAEPSLEMHAVDVQQDATWGLDRLDQAELPLDNSFEYPSQSGNGVKVFVIDTGVRCTHDEFSGRCISGWSAFNGGACLQGSACANDGNGHGTHCAGTIAGSTYGVAKSATIVAVKVLSDSGSGSYAGVLGGMEWVLAQKVADTSATPMVASMSLGGGFSQAINDAVMAMKNGGVAVAVAAGNDNADACGYSPARAPDAITVGSTTSSDARSSFSNFGSCVDIFAPGSAITSSWINSDSSTNTISGTSMACPHVAGVLAQILGSEPSLTPSQAEDLLKENALANVVSNSRTTPNIFLHNRFGPSAPTAAPAPTPPPTSRPTSAPTTHPFYQGDILCGETKTGDTRGAGDLFSNPSNEHTYSFVVDAQSSFEISACGSAYDTFLRLYKDGVEIANNDDSCALNAEIESTLSPGRYTILIEGYSSAAGVYLLSLSGTDCNPTTTTTTFPDTAVEPTVSPTSAPTTSAPTAPSRVNQGPLMVGDRIVDADTRIPGINIIGNKSPDHTYSVTILSAGRFTFSLCDGASFDTFMRLYDSEMNKISRNNDACGTNSKIVKRLQPGTYTLLIEGYRRASGTYTLTMDGPPQATHTPTPQPTSNAPTTHNPASSPTPPPNPSPVVSPSTESPAISGEGRSYTGTGNKPITLSAPTSGALTISVRGKHCVAPLGANGPSSTWKRVCQDTFRADK